MKLSLLGTNISPKNGILKMIFLFPRWDMLIPWRVPFSNMLPFPRGKKSWICRGFSDHQAPLGDAPALCCAQTAMALGGPGCRLRKSGFGGHLEVTLGKVYLNPPGNKHDWLENPHFLFELGDTPISHGGLTSSHLSSNRAFPKGKDHLPTTVFQGAMFVLGRVYTYLTYLPIKPPLPVGSSTPPHPGFFQQSPIRWRYILLGSGISYMKHHETFIFHWKTPGRGGRQLIGGWRAILKSGNPSVSYPTNCVWMWLWLKTMQFSR